MLLSSVHHFLFSVSLFHSVGRDSDRAHTTHVQTGSQSEHDRKRSMLSKIMEQIYPYEEKLRFYFVEAAFLIEYLQSTNFILQYVHQAVSFRCFCYYLFIYLFTYLLVYLLFTRICLLVLDISISTAPNYFFVFWFLLMKFCVNL
jgi:hypothetical protein